MIFYTEIMTIQNPIYNYVKYIFILIGSIIIKRVSFIRLI